MRLAVPLTLALVALALPSSVAAAAEPRVLVFSATAGFRHDSIPDARATLRALGRRHGFRVRTTEDAGVFTVPSLRRYRAVVFALTTGDVLNPMQEAALESFVRRGGGWMGIHSAADTEYSWPFYGTLLAGAWFREHPPIYATRLVVERRGHPSTRHLGRRWSRTDEWYRFRANPRSRARVLIRLPETTEDVPIAWCRRVGRGISFYTGLGHTRESYGERGFIRHLLGGLRSVTSKRRPGCRPGG